MMPENKLFQYLKKLDNAEMKRFVLFLRSPYHSTNKPALKLVENLIKFHPEFDSPRLKKETIFKKIYGNSRSFHEGRLGQVMTQTVKLYEQFLAVEASLADQLKVGQNRMAAFKKKRLDKAFFKEVEKRKKQIKKMPEGPIKYLEGCLLNRELFFHPATERAKVDMPCLDDYIENLDWFILWEKQLTTNYAMNRELVFSKKYKMNLYEEIAGTMKEQIEENYTLSILSQLTKQYSQLEINSIAQLVDDFIENYQSINEDLRPIILSMLKNIMARGHRSRPEFFSKQLFLIMRFSHKNKKDLFDAELSANYFTGLISIAAKVNEFEYAIGILENDINLVKLEDREDVKNLGYGYIYFCKGIEEGIKENYSQAMEYLNKVNQNKPFFTYQVKSLLLRCYYELYLSDVESQYFILDYSLAFERHLSRDKSLSENKTEAYSTFCKLVRKLVKLRFDEKEKKMVKLEEFVNQINSNSVLFGKEWLLNKVKELQKQPLEEN